MKNSVGTIFVCYLAAVSTVSAAKKHKYLSRKGEELMQCLAGLQFDLTQIDLVEEKKITESEFVDKLSNEEHCSYVTCVTKLVNLMNEDGTVNKYLLKRYKKDDGKVKSALTECKKIAIANTCQYADCVVLKVFDDNDLQDMYGDLLDYINKGSLSININV